MHAKRKQIITFSRGPRVCLPVGEYLAQTEIFLVLKLLFHKFKLKVYKANKRNAELMYNAMLPLK
jgi:cytochrome P450